MSSINSTISSIEKWAIQVGNFEIKPAIIQMIQQSVKFGGLSQVNPNIYIANFLEICYTFKHNRVTNNAIRLRVFSFSLRDKAKAWLNYSPLGIITTWEELVQKFLFKYFHPTKTFELRNNINCSLNLKVSHSMRHERDTKSS